VNCRCLSLSAAAALIELPADLADLPHGGKLSVELSTGRIVDAPALSARRVHNSRRLVLRFDWSGFAAMREFWTNCLDEASPRELRRRRRTAWASAEAAG